MILPQFFASEVIVVYFECKPWSDLCTSHSLILVEILERLSTLFSDYREFRIGVQLSLYLLLSVSEPNRSCSLPSFDPLPVWQTTSVPAHIIDVYEPFEVLQPESIQ